MNSIHSSTAFELAMKRNKKLTSIDKANVLESSKLCDIMTPGFTPIGTEETESYIAENI